MMRRLAGPLVLTLFASMVATLIATDPASPGAPPERADVPIPAFPQPVRRTLENGLRVAVFPVHRFPIAEIQLMIAGGQTSEPPGLAGVALLTAQLLTRGTTSRDAQLFDLDVARLGGTITSSTSRDYATLAGAFLARDLGPGLELVSDAAINPVFGDEDVQSVRLGAMRTAQQIQREGGTLADEQVWSVLFRNSPYGRSAVGSDSSRAAITRDQIRAFHRDHYRPDAAMLVIAGDVSPDTAFALAAEWFGRWSGHAVPAARSAPPSPPARPQVRVVDAPEARYSVLRLGLPLPGRRSDDDAPLALAATEFAGGSFARLQSPRVAKRLGATATSSLLALRDGGVFSFGARVNTDSVAAIVDLLREELRNFSRHPVIESELPAIRRGSVGALLTPLETLGGLIGQWAGMTFLDLPADVVSRTATRFSRMRADEIDAAVKRWFDPDHVAIVVVGPAKLLEPQLARFGPVEVIRARTPATPVSVVDTLPPTPENLARGREIVQRAFQAHGGLEALQGIHDSMIQMKIAIGPSEYETPGTIRQMRKEPNRLVSITQLRDFQSRQVLNGNLAWSVTGTTLLDADSAQTVGMRASYLSDLPHLLLMLRGTGVRNLARGTDRLLQRDVDVLETRLADGQYRRYYFDAETHLLSDIDIFEGLPGASTHRSRRMYGGYQTVDGIRWPFREERHIDGQRAMRIEITEVNTNIGVLDKEFEKPPATPR